MRSDCVEGSAFVPIQPLQARREQSEIMRQAYCFNFMGQWYEGRAFMAMTNEEMEDWASHRFSTTESHFFKFTLLIFCGHIF